MALSMQVTVDCAQPERLARFWCEVLGYRLPDPPPGFATWDAFADHHGIPPEQRDDLAAAEDPEGHGPRLFFQKVPEGKTAKNRMHIDVNVRPRGTPAEERRREAERLAEHLVTLGATKVGPVEVRDEFWVVMTDPEGNEFCLQ